LSGMRCTFVDLPFKGFFAIVQIIERFSAPIAEV